MAREFVALQEHIPRVLASGRHALNKVAFYGCPPVICVLELDDSAVGKGMAPNEELELVGKTREAVKLSLDGCYLV